MGRWAWFSRLWRTRSEEVVVTFGPMDAEETIEPVLDADGLIDVDRTVEKYGQAQKWGPLLTRQAREEHLRWVRESYEDVRREQERGA